MNGLDLAILIVLCLSICVGFFQGVVRQILSLLALYVAMVLAAQYHHIVGTWLGSVFPTASQLNRATIAFVIVFIAGLMVVNYFTYRAYRYTLIGHFGIVDHLAGGAVGVVIGWLSILVLLLVINYALQMPWFAYEEFKVTLATLREQSALVPRFLDSAPVVAEMVRPWIPSGVPTLFTP